MRRTVRVIRGFLTGLILSAGIWAQAPTGTIAGLVTDPAGAAIGHARVAITNPATGMSRMVLTSDEGTYSTPSLPAGVYGVTAEAVGFSKLTRMATVEAGTTTTVNLDMQVGAVSESVTVDGASPQIRYDSPQVGGVVHREQIQELPLNGRSYLELAKLEPGVTPPTRSTNNRTFIAVLGGPRPSTRTTVDGGSIMQIGAPGSVLNLSQEVVQEFQIATVNMDNSTGITAQGGINIVTRSGGNALHGSGFYFLRDHHLSAYPALSRDPTNPDPFFQRQQWGFAAGGPIKKDRVFFFANLERNNQRGVASVQAKGDFAAFAGIYPAPLHADPTSARFDFRLNDKHTAFVRYSHDGNNTISQNGGGVSTYPSNWLRIPNWADQSLAALTSVLRPTVVNDFRFSYFFLSAPGGFPLRPSDCPGCIGIGAPEIDIPGAGFVIGNSLTNSTVGRRYHFNESLSWQKSAHRMRMGFEYEWAAWSIQGLPQEPAVLNLYSPAEVRQANPGIPLPASFTTLDAILRLPLQSFQTGIGSPWPYQPNGAKIRAFDSWRLYWQDTWQVRPRLALNYGVSWAYSPHDHNYDLSKPAYLTPILGMDGLAPTRSAPHNVAPSLGLAWSIGRDAKTVIRAGAGLFYDNNLNAVPSSNERKALGPRGTGRSMLNGSGIPYNGSPLDFPIGPTTFTGADLLRVLPGIRAELLAQRNPNNRDFSVRNIDVDKQGEIYDHDFSTPYAVHLNLGIQRQLARDLVVSADFVLRQFTHNFITGIDYNHYNSLRGPVIPKCIGAQAHDPHAECSNGTITVDNTAGRSKYKGLLVRVDKRLSRRIQFLGSYALSSNVGFNGPGQGFNNDNWFSSYGPVNVDQRHILNLSGIVELPKRFRVAFNSAFYSRMPFNVFVNNLDFHGSGYADVLPGARVNEFNRGLDKNDLVRLVDQFNQTLAGTKTSRGQAIPVLRLPANYDFGKNFQTQDVRVSRTFVYRERYKLTLMGEVFNLLNIANLGGYSGNIGDTANFGQPQSRADQVFGSGGPRSFQLAARFTF